MDGESVESGEAEGSVDGDGRADGEKFGEESGDELVVELGVGFGLEFEFLSMWISPGPSCVHVSPLTVTVEVPPPSWSISTFTWVSEE